jgi:hypothetical protein
MATLAGLAGRDPSKLTRGFLRNLDMGGKAIGGVAPDFAFWFRPTPIRESIKASYDKMKVMGMSHQYPVYQCTENLTISFDLYVNALMLARSYGQEREAKSNKPGYAYKEGGRNDKNRAVEAIEMGRRFLHALAYPAEGPAGVIGARTPVVILCLPGVATLRGQVTGVECSISDVFIDGAVKELTASVSFEELPIARVTMQDVLAGGFTRTYGDM